MSQLAAQIPALQYTITVLSGPEKGTVYRLVTAKIYLGRGSENDIVVGADPKVSRRHAKISVTDNGVIITNLAERNKILVNGEEQKAAPLADNSKFTLGDTEFKFNASPAVPSVTSATAPALPPLGSQSMAPSPAPFGGLTAVAPSNAAPMQAHKPLGSGKLNAKALLANKRTRFYTIIGGVLFLFLLLVLTDSGKKANDDFQLRTQKEINAAISANDALLKSMKVEETKEGKGTIGFEEAQSFFVKGFRDYRDGRFQRAMTSFQACLSTFPQYEKCQSYFRLAEKRANELTQYDMILGRQYKEQDQFSACASAFRNVMTRVRDRNSKIYQEALSNFRFCKAKMGERF